MNMLYSKLTYTTFNLIMKMLGAFLPNPRALLLLLLPLTDLALRKGIHLVKCIVIILIFHIQKIIIHGIVFAFHENIPFNLWTSGVEMLSTSASYMHSLKMNSVWRWWNSKCKIFIGREDDVSEEVRSVRQLPWLLWVWFLWQC